MTIELLRLEWRRNRLSAAAAAASFLLTLPLARVVASAAGLEPARALEALLVGWLGAGIPLASALIGAASGSAAGARDAADAEAPLPLSPERRAAAALAVALLLALLFAAFALAASLVLGRDPAGALSPGDKSWGGDFLGEIRYAPLLALALLDLVAGAWACARLSGHGVAGGLAALVLTAGAGAGLLAAYGLELVYAEWGAFAGWPALSAACLGALAKARAGALAARWRERRDGARTALAAAALLAAPAAACWVFVALQLDDLRGRVAFQEPPLAYRYQSNYDQAPRTAAALAAAGRGALVSAPDGDLFLAGANGLAPLGARAGAGLGELLFKPAANWLLGAWRGPDGALWIERIRDYELELVRERAGAVASRRIPRDEGGTVDMSFDALHKTFLLAPKLYGVASLDDYLEHGRGARVETLAAYRARRLAQASLARPACGRRCLKTPKRTWTLPGRAIHEGAVYPHQQGGPLVYLVPVATKKGPIVAACREDGRVGVAWPLRRTPRGIAQYGALPDGTLFTLAPGRILWLLEPGAKEGRSLPLAGVSGALGGGSSLPVPLWRENAVLWLSWNGWLAAVDANGGLTRRLRLPPGTLETRPLNAGALARAPGALYAVDRDGRARSLRRPD